MEDSLEKLSRLQPREKGSKRRRTSRVLKDRMRKSQIENFKKSNQSARIDGEKDHKAVSELPNG